MKLLLAESKRDRVAHLFLSKNYSNLDLYVDPIDGHGFYRRNGKNVFSTAQFDGGTLWCMDSSIYTYLTKAFGYSDGEAEELLTQWFFDIYGIDAWDVSWPD